MYIIIFILILNFKFNSTDYYYKHIENNNKFIKSR